MEKRNNKLYFYFIIFIISLIIVGTFIKAYNIHIDNLYKVIEKKIEENSVKCILDEVCTSNEFTLGFLEQNGYLDKQVDPLSKEYIKDDTKITCENYECHVTLR